jgi:hypothetical protein
LNTSDPAHNSFPSDAIALKQKSIAGGLHAHSIAHSTRCAALTIDEAIEFEMLDALAPVDDNGNIGWIFEGEPVSRRKKCWLELSTKLTMRQPRQAPVRFTG